MDRSARRWRPARFAFAAERLTQIPAHRHIVDAEPASDRCVIEPVSRELQRSIDHARVLCLAATPRAIAKQQGEGRCLNVEFFGELFYREPTLGRAQPAARAERVVGAPCDAIPCSFTIACRFRRELRAFAIVLFAPGSIGVIALRLLD